MSGGQGGKRHHGWQLSLHLCMLPPSQKHYNYSSLEMRTASRTGIGVRGCCVCLLWPGFSLLKQFFQRSFIHCNTFLLGDSYFQRWLELPLPSPSAHHHLFSPLCQKHSLVDSKSGQIKVQWPQKPCCFTLVLSKLALSDGVPPPTFSAREVSTCSVAFWYVKGHCQVIEVKNMTLP